MKSFSAQIITFLAINLTMLFGTLLIPSFAFAHNCETTTENSLDNSEARRKEKVFSLTATGFDMSGLRLGFFLTPNLMAETAFYQGEYTYFLYRPRVRELEMYLKGFWGNSFYTSLGLAYRYLQDPKNYRTNSVRDDGSYVTENSTTDLGVKLTLGNQWNWSIFTLGIDWVDVFFPVHNMYKSDNFQPRKINMNLFFLRPYLGVSF